jgi:RNA polymerase sigma-70 factor (ECF subfamily)
LLTVVRNRARDLWRHQVIEERFVVERTTSRDADDATGHIARGMDPGRCRAEAGSSPVRDVAVYVSGMTRAEIAAETGMSETQVKGHLQYALSLLRKQHGCSHE